MFAHLSAIYFGIALDEFLEREDSVVVGIKMLEDGFQLVPFCLFREMIVDVTDDCSAERVV